MLLRLVQLGFDGLTLGSLVALGAMGLTLTYSILKLPNFAQGDWMTVGAYGAWWLVGWGLPLPVAMLGGIGVTIGLILLSEKLLWSPLRAQRSPMTTLIIASMGLALFLRNGILLIWGAGNQDYGLPLAEPWTVFCVRLVGNRVVILGVAIVAMVMVHGLLQRTALGKAMRAVADNPDLAQVTGIPVQRVMLWTWVLAGSLTALGGGLYGLMSAIRPNMGWFLILPLFAAVVVGGIGQVYGAIGAALAIGVLQEVSTLWLPNAYKPAIALIVVMLILWIRPQGLWGRS
ncbi:MAG: branched-chain amino acid ABC transporter permease [Prochlorothrix sp.]